MYTPEPTLKQRWSFYISAVLYSIIQGLFISVLLNIVLLPIFYLVNMMNYMSEVALIISGVIVSLLIIWRCILLLAHKHAKPESFKRMIVKRYNPSLIIRVVEEDTEVGVEDLFVKVNNSSKTRTKTNGVAKFVLDEGEYDIDINQSFTNDDYKGKTIENVEINDNNGVKKMTVELDEKLLS